MSSSVVLMDEVDGECLTVEDEREPRNACTDETRTRHVLLPPRISIVPAPSNTERISLALRGILCRVDCTMPTVPLLTRPPSSLSPVSNPLPSLLQTPSGLALVELQGDIRFPPTAAQSSTQVGKLAFPLYNPSINGEGDTKWMKRVYFYVGKNQRMAGEVKKLGKPFAILKKNETIKDGDVVMRDDEATSGGDALEIVDIVKYKIIFATRPEPVGGGVEETV